MSEPPRVIAFVGIPRSIVAKENVAWKFCAQYRHSYAGFPRHGSTVLCSVLQNCAALQSDAAKLYALSASTEWPSSPLVEKQFSGIARIMSNSQHMSMLQAVHYPRERRTCHALASATVTAWRKTNGADHETSAKLDAPLELYSVHRQAVWRAFCLCQRTRPREPCSSPRDS